MNDATMPTARSKSLVISETDDELLVYDLASHTIHQLNHASTLVWRACDGYSTVNDIALRLGFTAEVVHNALTKLDTASLFTEKLMAGAPATNTSRRGFLKKAAIAGSIPAIVSVSAPAAAMAASTPGTISLVCGLATEDCSNFVVCCASHCTSLDWSINGVSLTTCTPNGAGGATAHIQCTCVGPN